MWPRKRNPARGGSASDDCCGRGGSVLGRRGTNLLAVDEEDDTIDEDRAQLAQPHIAHRRGDARRHASPCKRFEPEEQPVGVVRDLENKRPIRGKGQRDLRPLEVVRAGGGGAAESDGNDGAEALHCAYHKRP